MKRALFVLAAALVAAATANPIVETIANTGVFGPGFADHDQSSVGPTIAIAACFALAFVVARTVGILRGIGRTSRLVAGVARDLSRRRPASDVPFVLALQFATLYAMERVECFVHGGVENGLAWLGGPPLFALAVHLIAGVLVTSALGWALRTLGRGLATLARAVFDAIALVRARASAARFARRACEAISGSSRTLGRAIRGRAPPHAPTLA